MDATAHSRPLLDSVSSNLDSEHTNGNEYSEDVLGTPASISGRYTDDGGIDNDGVNTTTNDEFEDDEDEEVLIKRPHIVPNDRLSFTYMAFYLLGMITLVPWNFFITAEPVSKIFTRTKTKNKELVDNFQLNETCGRIYQSSLFFPKKNSTLALAHSFNYREKSFQHYLPFASCIRFLC